MFQQNYRTIGLFDASVEDWTSYEEHFRLYFTPNKITDDDKKRATFLTRCAAVTYTLFQSLAALKKPIKISIAELLKLAAAHYHPKPTLAVHCFRFSSETCQVGESVASYLTEQKRLSEHRSFGDTLNNMLRDRIVCGIQDQSTQLRLLVEPDLTLQKAFKVDQAIESAETQVKELQHPPWKYMPLAPNLDCFEHHPERAHCRALPPTIVH